MRINLYTDAPKHNLALMKISTYHKQMGDEVTLNMPIMPCDKSYASILFERNVGDWTADQYGGAAYDSSCLPPEIEGCRPDYSLFKFQRIRNRHIGEVVIENDYSLGYTFRGCLRRCPFCKVWKMHQPDYDHHSIWEFHDPKFKKICLLNNNTFFDGQWKDTFEEIWDAHLTVIDENGYDLRLMDEEKAEYLHKTHFQGQIHYAWDRIQDETTILKGLTIAPKGTVYVLIGFESTEEEDIYRVQKIVDAGHDPYIMPFHQSEKEKRFKRFMDLFMWRKYKTIEEAWKSSKP
jgi:hypothetical protein